MVTDMMKRTKSNVTALSVAVICMGVQARHASR